MPKMTNRQGVVRGKKMITTQLLTLRWAASATLTTTPWAESVIGPFKTKVINLLGPWKSMAQVEWQTLHWVHWFNTKRLHSAIGYLTPNYAEDCFYANLDNTNKAA